MPITVAHVFTNNVPDVIGTVTVFNAAAPGSTTTVAATDIVKPSDWNSSHAVTYNPTGQEIIGAFSNGGNVTFGTNLGGYVTASAPVGGGGAATSFSNANNVTFGLAGSTITASASYPAQTAFVFSNSNGVSFGTNGSTITATVKTDYLTTAQPPGAYLTTAMGSNAGSNFVQANAVFNGTNASGTIASNGISISVGAGGGGADGYNIIGVNGGATQLSTTYQFSNANNVSFGLNAGTITASASYAAQTVDTNKAGTGFTSTSTAGSLVVGTHGTNGLSLGIPNYLTTAQPVGAYLTTARGSTDAIGLNTALTANGVSMTANSSGLSLNFPAFLTTAQSPGAYLTTAAQSSVSNVSGIIAGTASNGGTATLSGNVSFSNANGVSFYTSAGNVVAATVRTDYQSAGAYLTTGANSTHSHGNPTLNLTNINGTTASNSAGLTLSLSAVVPAQTVQPVAISGSNGSFAFSTLTMGNLNGLSFYSSNGSIVGSYTVPAGGGVTVLSNSNNVSFGLAGSTYTATATFNQSNQTGNIYVTANSTQLSSTAGIDLRSLSFAGAGIASVGVSNGVVLVSVPSGGGAGDGVNIIQAGTTGTTGTTYSASTGTMFINGGNNITVSQNGANQLVISAAQGGIAAGTQTATSGTLVFANSNGVTFGMSGSSQITASVNAGGGGFTKTFWYPYNEAVNVMGQHGQATFVINPLPLDDVLHADRIVFPVFFSNSSNSTGSLTVSYWVGIYSKNGSTLSSAASTSFTATLGYAGNNSSGQQQGIRLLTAPWTTTLQQSRYYVGIGVRSTTAGTNATLSQVLVSQLNSNVSGMWDVASTRSIQWPIGVGYFSASTTGVPSTIALSHIDGTNSLAARPPSWHMISGTA